jgi:hypothetical protein
MEVIIDLLILIFQFIVGISITIGFPLFIVKMMESPKRKYQDFGALAFMIFIVIMVVAWGEGMREDEPSQIPPVSTSISQ